MKTFSDLAAPSRQPTPLERQAIAEVHELAERFALDAVTTTEIRAACSGKQRWLATRFTAPSDPNFQSLMDMLDALIAEDHRFTTKHGAFTPEDVFTDQGRIVYEDGRAMLQFPYKVPWITKPDPNAGVVGVPDEPVYRRPDQRGPFVTETDTPIEFTEVDPAEKEWWELGSSEEVPF